MKGLWKGDKEALNDSGSTLTVMGRCWKVMDRSVNK